MMSESNELAGRCPNHPITRHPEHWISTIVQCAGFRGHPRLDRSVFEVVVKELPDPFVIIRSTKVMCGIWIDQQCHRFIKITQNVVQLLTLVPIAEVIPLSMQKQKRRFYALGVVEHGICVVCP